MLVMTGLSSEVHVEGLPGKFGQTRSAQPALGSSARGGHLSCYHRRKYELLRSG